MALKDVGVKLVVEGTSQFKNKMKSADASVVSFGQKVERAGAGLRKVGIGMTAVGGVISGVLAMAVREASNAQEMISKFNVVFRDQAPVIEQWAKTLGTAVKRSRFEIMGMAASLQDTFVPMGFAREKAAELSKGLVELAIDVASFNNKADAEVIRDFQSALVGNTETVRKYGIVITAAQVEQEILNRGWATSKSEITEAMKVQARYTMIIDGSTDAIGDAGRTSGSFANEMKGVKASIQEAAIVIGDTLLPILSKMINKVNTVVRGISGFLEKNKKLTSVIVLLSGGFGGLLLTIGPILIVLPTLVRSFTILRKLLVTKMIPAIIALGISAVAATLALVGLTLGIGMVVLALMELNKRSNQRAAIAEIEEERTKALAGETNNLADAYQRAIDKGYIPSIPAVMKYIDVLKEAEAAAISSAEATELNRKALLKYIGAVNAYRRSQISSVFGGISAAVLSVPEEEQAALYGALRKQAFTPGGILVPVAPARETINTTTINVEAYYTNLQDPAGIVTDLELLMLEANR